MLPPNVIGAGPADGGHLSPGLTIAQSIQLGNSGSCPAAGSTVFIVLDESASVASAGGNDPLSRRHGETALAIRHVAASCRCRRDRVALVPFDAGSAGHVAPQALTGSGIRQLQRGLRLLANSHGMSSNLAPALEHVETLTAHADSDTAVVVFSDFLLTDQDPNAVLSRLRTFPGHVHAVVLGAQPPSVLIADPNVTITWLTPSSSPGSAAQAVFDGLTRYRTRQTSDAGGAARTLRNPLQRRRTHHMANLMAMGWSP